MAGWDLALWMISSRVGGWDLTEWLERLTANAVVATVLGSITASSDTVESEGRQMKQCWISYRKKEKLIKKQWSSLNFSNPARVTFLFLLYASNMSLGGAGGGIESGHYQFTATNSINSANTISKLQWKLCLLCPLNSSIENFALPVHNILHSL